MKDKLDGGRVGLVLGLFMVAVHLIWAIMVIAGLAQQWIDWMLGLHMLNNPLTVGAFSWGTTIMLLIVVFVVGYILGWIFAWVHNSVHKK
ncbi:MAG: hypothetical protein V1826_02460 [bacterium]